MNKNNSIQATMFRDLESKSAYELAKTCGFHYLDHALERNVFPTEKAMQDLAKFEEKMPEWSTPAKEVIRLLHVYGSPATVSQIGGRYFGFVDGSAVPAGMAAKLLATFWDQNTAMHVMSPISSKLECIVEHWMKELFNLPQSTVAGFVSGTSPANFCGLAAARWRILNRLKWDVNQKGVRNAPLIRIVAGRHAHSAVVKAVSLLGFGKESIEWVATDSQGRILPEALPQLDERTILILQAGDVNTGAFDPFRELCEKAKKANAWVHIDGAFGLWAAASETLKHLTMGIELADSWAVDGHKTLNTPYDCGIALCKDREAYLGALQIAGSYLNASDEARDGMLFTPEASRRSRIIELWATLKFLGKQGLSQMIDGMHERALQFERELGAIRGFRILNEVVFNQVLVGCDDDEITQDTLKKIQDLRECWVGGSAWEGKRAIRISVCSWATTPDDITRSTKSFERALNETMEANLAFRN